MSLLVVSYPQLAQDHADWIRSTREADPRLKFSNLSPHFTLVFPVSSVSENELAEHVRGAVSSWKRIPFVIRGSMLVKDDLSDDYYVMLVPDEGFSSVVRLHDRLYTGPLADALRVDLPFIPHITLGYSSDLAACKAVVDQINTQALAIEGQIVALSIVKKQDGQALTMEEFPLA